MLNITNSIEKLITDKRAIYSYSRIKNYESTLKNCKSFEQENKCDSTQDYINRYFLHMAEKSYANSSIISSIKAIKKALNHSGETDTFKIKDITAGVRKTAKTGKIFLKKEQVMQIYSFNTRFKKTRDLFVFCCFTGLRYNEAMRITSDNIQKCKIGKKEIEILKYTTSKNNSVNQVPLNSVCKEILENWKTGNRLLPYVSNSKANLNLHLLLKEMGTFDNTTIRVHYSGKERVEQVMREYEQVTFHCSRHSFAFHLLDNGMNMKEVSDIMGVSVTTLELWYAHSDTDSRNLKAIKILEN